MFIGCTCLHAGKRDAAEDANKATLFVISLRERRWKAEVCLPRGENASIGEYFFHVRARDDTSPSAAQPQLVPCHPNRIRVMLVCWRCLIVVDMLASGCATEGFMAPINSYSPCQLTDDGAGSAAPRLASAAGTRMVPAKTRQWVRGDRRPFREPKEFLASFRIVRGRA